VQTGSDEENHGGLTTEDKIKGKLKLFVGTTGTFCANKITERLIEECGSASAVFGAPKYRIERAVGAGSQVGLALRTARWLSIHCFEEQATHRPLIESSRALLSYLGAAMAQDTRETVRILYVTASKRLIKVEVAFKGRVDESDLDPRYVLKRALELGAAGMILVHNHPSGIHEHSPNDRRITWKIASLCAEFDIHLLDHIVVGLHGAKSLIWDKEVG
jgi:DNA repair protein RadC